MNSNFTPAPPRLNIQKHAMQIFVNSETCTYIGTNGHLFWTLATADCWATPNVSCYIILCMAMLCAKPKRFFAGVGIWMGLLVLSLNSYYRGSVETASMWCCTGILMHFYFIAQPYVLPCNDQNSYCPDTFAYSSGDNLPITKSSLEKGS